jgi:hypothetical protein
MAILLLAMSACRGVGAGDPATATPSPTIPAAASIQFHALQDRCCWMEGSFSYAALDGPSRLSEFRLDSRVDAGEFDPNKPLEIGERAVSVTPGHYTLTVWQRPCDGNCGYLDPPTGNATAEFDVSPGEQLAIRVMFKLGAAADIQLGGS